MRILSFLGVWVLLMCVVAGATPGAVYVVPLKGDVSEAQFVFLRRTLKAAERADASAFVLEMDTNGGAVEAAVEIMNALGRTPVPTVVYVNTRALSAGALISLAAGRIYMAPTAVMGAAAPVLEGGGDLSETMREKTVSAISAIARAAAERNGRNPDIADAFIDKRKELRVGGELIDGPDSLLTLSAQEAVREHGGKRLLADGVGASLEEVLALAGLKGSVVRVEPAGFERAALWITSLAPLLLMGGIVFGFIESKIPGFGFFGILSITCFGLFFAGHHLAGLAGWEAAALFAVGIALVVGELWLHPGTVVPGVLGVFLAVGGMVLAMADRWPGEPFWPSEGALVRPLFQFGAAMIGSVIVVAVLVRVLPRTRFYSAMVLSEVVPMGPGVEVGPAWRAVIGSTGVALTTLRPSGKASLGGHTADVVSQGEFLDAGTRLRVVRIEGPHVVVEREG